MGYIRNTVWFIQRSSRIYSKMAVCSRVLSSPVRLCRHRDKHDPCPPQAVDRIPGRRPLALEEILELRSPHPGICFQTAEGAGIQAGPRPHTPASQCRKRGVHTIKLCCSCLAKMSAESWRRRLIEASIS